MRNPQQVDALLLNLGNNTEGIRAVAREGLQKLGDLVLEDIRNLEATGTGHAKAEATALCWRCSRLKTPSLHWRRRRPKNARARAQSKRWNIPAERRRANC